MKKTKSVLPHITTRKEWIKQRKSFLKKRKGWNFPFYSSGESDFNYDFQATIERNRNTEYNYQADTDCLNGYEGDVAGKSVFLKAWEDSPDGWPQKPTYE